MKTFLPRPGWQFALAIFAVVLLSKPAGTDARRLHAPSVRNLEHTALSSEDGHEATDIADLLELEDASEVQPASLLTPTAGTSWYCDSVCSVASHISQACHNAFGKWGRARCNDFCHACDASCSGHPFSSEWQRLQVKYCTAGGGVPSPTPPTTPITPSPVVSTPADGPRVELIVTAQLTIDFSDTRRGRKLQTDPFNGLSASSVEVIENTIAGLIEPTLDSSFQTLTSVDVFNITGPLNQMIIKYNANIQEVCVTSCQAQAQATTIATDLGTSLTAAINSGAFSAALVQNAATCGNACTEIASASVQSSSVNEVEVTVVGQPTGSPTTPPPTPPTGPCYGDPIVAYAVYPAKNPSSWEACKNNGVTLDGNITDSNTNQNYVPDLPFLVDYVLDPLYGRPPNLDELVGNRHGPNYSDGWPYEQEVLLYEFYRRDDYSNSIKYAFPVTSGKTYRVTVRLTEYTDPGNRGGDDVCSNENDPGRYSFNINLEDEVVRENLNVYNETDRTFDAPLDLTFIGEAQDGTLNLNFTANPFDAASGETSVCNANRLSPVFRISSTLVEELPPC